MSPFLTWVDVVLLGSLNLFQLFEAAGRPTGWAWATLLIGVAVALAAWRQGGKPSTVRKLGLIVGILAGLLAIAMLENMLHDVRDAHGLARVSYGPYIAVGGCIAMVVGGVMSKGKRPAPASPAPS